MIALGTIVNCAAIIGGSTLGLFLRGGLPERLRTSLMQAVGLAVLFIGISGALQGLLKQGAGAVLERGSIMVMILSLVAGALAGELIDIDGRLVRLGNFLEQRFAKDGGDFTKGFVSSSLIYCIGAMAILGSFDDGLKGDTTVLFAKAVLDGVTAVVFAASLGIGVLFSAIIVAAYQGALTLLALQLQSVLSEEVILQMSLVGSVLLAGIGISLLEIKAIKVSNLLPAVAVPPIYQGLCDMVSALWR